LEAANLSGADQSPLVDSLVALISRQQDSDAKRQLLVSLPPKPLCDDRALVQELADSLSDSVGRPESNGSVLWKCLKRLKISTEFAQKLIALSPKFLPTELMQAAELVASLRNDELDQSMLKQLLELKAARAIPTNSLLNLYRDRSPAVRESARTVSDQLLQSDPQVKQTVKSLLEKLPPGDQVRGLTLYHSSKANCGACHQMGYRGGKIGPELSRIGGSRTREAILEAVLFPSQRIEQGYDTTRILTADGRVLNGIVLSRTDSQTSLRVSADKVEVVQNEDIEELRGSEVSIMPAGMLELLSLQELADLLSLLEASKN
jgi:putative heme-binding domain-containing protein